MSVCSGTADAGTTSQVKCLCHTYSSFFHITPTALLNILVKPRPVNYLRSLAVDEVKTGMGGTTGNKGGVAIRFQVLAIFGYWVNM